ncbi:hypothetical protein [Streptomyces cyaneogriseus]|jgi:hypothetical protein|uniref:hypothetical protein n=1 Tax=Streptomyces cyaneogriseus TaxID=68192 RepID=UPI000AB1C0EC|nr:hypothetical protein [Streptomyces cyaneogriseus]
MTEHTPSQAEGDRDDERDTPDRQSPPRPTPSQAEGDRDDSAGSGTGNADRSG